MAEVNVGNISERSLTVQKQMDLEEGRRIESEENSTDHIKAAKTILKNMELSGFGGATRNIGDGDVRNLKLLDPNHPSMIKFQMNLKEHVEKLHLETDEQVRELTGAINRQINENDSIGKHVSILQNELVKCKNRLSKLHKSHLKAQKQGQELNDKVNEVENMNHSINEELARKRSQDTKLQKEMEDTALQLVQLKDLQVQSYTDALTMSRAKEMTSKQKEVLAMEKLRQDHLITRLETDLHELQNKVNLFKAQNVIKLEELVDLRKVLLDAVSFMEDIQHEKLLLMQQWSHSIFSLEKRDQICADMHVTIRKRDDDIIILVNNIANHKKSVRKELQENEKLTMWLMHIDSDVARSEMVVEDCKMRLRNLEEQFAFFEQLVMQTDQELAILESACEAISKEIEAKVRALERAFAKQRELDTEQMRKLHDKITLTKTSHATEQMIKEQTAKIQELETKIILEEGDKAKLHLKLADSEGHLKGLEENISNLTTEYNDKTETIANSEAELAKGHLMIEKKQMSLAEMNSRLGDLISNAGGSELGPLEREIANIRKEIVISEKTRKTEEQVWLRYQKELVSLTNEASATFKENDTFRRKETILDEQKIRVEAELNFEDKEIRDLLQDTERTRNDMDHLNALLHLERGFEERLEQEMDVLKCDFLSLMKEVELSFIKKESELEHLRNKRTRLLYKVVEAQQQTVLWEEKLQWVEETKKILRSASYTAEMTDTKVEIRRFEMRLEQIRKEMAAIILHMEKLAFRYVTLYVKTGIECTKTTELKQKQYLKPKKERLKKMMKNQKKRLEASKKELDRGKPTILELKEIEQTTKSTLTNLKTGIGQIENDTVDKFREKWQEVTRLSFKLKMSKLLQKFKDDKYVHLFHDAQLRFNEVKKVHNSLALLTELINDLTLVHPELQNNVVQVKDHTSVGLQM